ncbi:DUF6531 domain-containing protein [Vibrio splendidus]
MKIIFLVLFLLIFHLGNSAINPVQASNNRHKNCPSGKVCEKKWYIFKGPGYIHESDSKSEACSKWYPTGKAILEGKWAMENLTTYIERRFCVVSGFTKLTHGKRSTLALTRHFYKVISTTPPIDNTSTGSQDCKIMTNHPVNIYSGNKFYQVQEFKKGGRNSLHFQRFYNSLTGRWTVTYSRNIDIANKRFYTDSGRVLPINGDIVEGYGLLERDILGSVIYSNDGSVEFYNEYGRLDKLINSNGGIKKFNYSGVFFVENGSGSEIEIFNKNDRNLIATIKYQYTSLPPRKLGFWSEGTLITVIDDFGDTFEFIIAHDGLKPQLNLKDGFLGYPIAWQSSSDSSAIFYYYNNDSPLSEVNYFNGQLISRSKKYIKTVSYKYDNLLLNGKKSYITKVIDGGNEISNVKYYPSGKVKESSINNGIERTSFKYGKDKRIVTNSNGKESIYTFTGNKLVYLEGLPSNNCLHSGTKYFHNESYGKSGNSVNGSKRLDGTFSLVRKDKLGRTVCILEGGETPEKRYITFDWYDKPSRIRKKVNGSYGIEYSYTGPLLLLSNVNKFTVEQGRSSSEQYSLCED